MKVRVTICFDVDAFLEVEELRGDVSRSRFVENMVKEGLVRRRIGYV